MATKADRYEGIDGLKAYAIIGIALMHVLANGEYGIGGFVFERLIPSFTNLVFLFMMVSGFGIYYFLLYSFIVSFTTSSQLYFAQIKSAA